MLLLCYTHRALSAGEVAAMFGISEPLLLEELARRRIRTMDVPGEEFEANSRRLVAVHGLMDEPRRRRKRRRHDAGVEPPAV